MFSYNNVVVALKSSSNSKAFEPDGLAPILSKHLGQNAITYFTALMNLYLTILKTPNVWKVGKIFLC